MKIVKYHKLTSFSIITKYFLFLSVKYLLTIIDDMDILTDIDEYYRGPVISFR